jgi:CCR4-NOT transcriptional complex subunit CAF120
MRVSVGTTTKAVAPSPENDAWDSPDATVTPKKRGISGLFSRDKSTIPPKQANIFLYNGRPRIYKIPVLKLSAVTQAFAVYPERPKIVSNHTLIRLEVDEGWMLLMPDLEGAGIGETLRWLVGERVPFADSRSKFINRSM